jgi:hypothetical protein
VQDITFSATMKILVLYAFNGTYSVKHGMSLRVYKRYVGQSYLLQYKNRANFHTTPPNTNKIYARIPKTSLNKNLSLKCITKNEQAESAYIYIKLIAQTS